MEIVMRTITSVLYSFVWWDHTHTHTHTSRSRRSKPNFHWCLLSSALMAGRV